MLPARNIGLIIGGILGCSALIMDAWATHGLRATLSPHDFESLGTAIRYQQIHAVLLVIIILMRANGHANAARIFLDSAAICFVAGCILFCGAIYLGVLAGLGDLLIVAPAGGLTLMLGWLMLACAGFRLANKA